VSVDRKCLKTLLSQELEKWQNSILKSEELLLEALGFDLVVRHPHAILSEIFTSRGTLPSKQDSVEDLAWSITTDSYVMLNFYDSYTTATISFRTPLCVLFDPMTTACASLAIATTVVEESDGPYLDQLLDQRADNGRPLDSGQSSFSNAIFLKKFLAQNELPIQDIKGPYSLILTLIHLNRFD
jgi:cyclin K